VGLVQPGINDGGFIIEWIGVVPEHRGHGYVADLLACGMSLLKRAGAEQIRADTHLRNRAMQRALSRAGFNRFGVRWWYEGLARA
jgi:RimJ/RimL family protein N-acetyltransferase